ncbi:hypothetical protein [Streptomyces sp. NPDC051572]|uniref:hypothetical protein n=1 Tax=Streptomyces sp. NPDC051572 TaxID=3155802 RepID=UPI00344C5168
MTGQRPADRLAAAYALADRLLAEQRRVEVLDRFGGLGTDLERTGVMAEVLARNGVVAIVPCAAESVAAVRTRHEASGTRYIEVSAVGREGLADSATAVQRLLVGRDRPTRRDTAVARVSHRHLATS